MYTPISVPVSKLYLQSLKSSPPQMKILLDKSREAVYTTDGTETLRIRSRLEQNKTGWDQFQGLPWVVSVILKFSQTQLPSWTRQRHFGIRFELIKMYISSVFNPFLRQSQCSIPSNQETKTFYGQSNFYGLFSELFFYAPTCRS